MNFLYFDDKCPLCKKTIKFLDNYVKPLDVSYVALSEANISLKELERALNEMLLISKKNQYFWGYDTYCKLFMLSKSKSSFLWKLISILMRLPVLKKFGKKIYIFIANTRTRCDDSCEI